MTEPGLPLSTDHALAIGNVMGACAGCGIEVTVIDDDDGAHLDTFKIRGPMDGNLYAVSVKVLDP